MVPNRCREVPTTTASNGSGLLLGMLEESHRLLVALVSDTPTRLLDMPAEPFPNTIGTLLHHVAATDIGWLHGHILETELDPEAKSIQSDLYWNAEGDLWPTRDLPIDDYLGRLEQARAMVVRKVRDMPQEEYDRPRDCDGLQISVAWILFHLFQHECYHRGQISTILRLVSSKA